MMFRMRKMEWVSSGVLFFTGLLMLFAPDSFTRADYSTFTQHALLWTYGCIVIGALRLTALWVNGHWNGGTPIIRMVGSILGMGVFGAFVGNLIEVSSFDSVPFGIVAYCGLMLGELLSTLYSASDVIKLNRK